MQRGKVQKCIGQRIPIRSNKEYDITENSFFIVKEFIKKGEHFWHFDERGIPVPKAKEDELPLDYQAKGNLYIKIKDFNFTQDNIYPCTCYSFEIYMYRKR